jgi:hypothetical protein
MVGIVVGEVATYLEVEGPKVLEVMPSLRVVLCNRGEIWWW